MSLCITACRVQEYVVKDVERKRPPPVFGLVEGDDPACSVQVHAPHWNHKPGQQPEPQSSSARGRHPHPHRPNVASCPVRPWVRRGRWVRPAAAPRPRQAHAPKGPSPRRPRAPAAARFQVREKKAESNSVCLFHTIHTNAQHSKSRRRRGAGSSDEHG